MILYACPRPHHITWVCTRTNQDVDQDVLSEFQRSPFSKRMATNKLNLTSFCVTGYSLIGQFILPEGLKPGSQLVVPGCSESFASMPMHVVNVDKYILIAISLNVGHKNRNKFSTGFHATL